MSFAYFTSYSNASRKFSLFPINNKTRYNSKIELPNADEFNAISKDPYICHFTVFKPWAANAVVPFLPVDNNLTLILQEWYQTASQVSEFKDELSELQFCKFNTFDLVTCYTLERISNIEDSMNKQIARRRRDRIIILSALAIILLLQLIFFFK